MKLSKVLYCFALFVSDNLIAFLNYKKISMYLFIKIAEYTKIAMK